jgi:hypothetical protein
LHKQGIRLQVGANPVINPVLDVGQVSDQIEVRANAALVETRTTGVSQVMDNVRVVELPLNGRQVTDLIVLSEPRRLEVSVVCAGLSDGQHLSGGRPVQWRDIPAGRRIA